MIFVIIKKKIFENLGESWEKQVKSHLRFRSQNKNRKEHEEFDGCSDATCKNLTLHRL